MQRATILAVLLVTACHSSEPVTSTGAIDATALFADKCAMCHGPTGKPYASMVARLNVRDLTAPEFRARVTVELVEHQVHAGSKNKLMPSFEGAISDDQMHAVAVYVASPDFIHR